MRKILIIAGPPGSGKGTQSKLIAQRFNYLHISTGDILREEVKKGSPEGLYARTFMDKGLLVPDELLNKIIKKKFEATSENLLFDGYPRNLSQAEFLSSLTGGMHVTVIWIKLAPEIIYERIKKRAMEEGRTDDTSFTVIKKRFEEYNEKTLPLYDYYKRQGNLTEINGDGTIEEVFNRIAEVLQKSETQGIQLPR